LSLTDNESNAPLNLLLNHISDFGENAPAVSHLPEPPICSPSKLDGDSGKSRKNLTFNIKNSFNHITINIG
jgi:hypothetical protein